MTRTKKPTIQYVIEKARQYRANGLSEDDAIARAVLEANIIIAKLGIRLS